MTATAPNLVVSDAELLRRYAASGDGGAFAALANRYLPLVYAAAVRQTRDPHLAEDVAQATLVILSEKAGRIDPALLPGWLLKTTHYAARNALRQRARRAVHEQRAAAMKRDPEVPPPSDPDAVARVIDPALARLRDKDRTAVVLRYFQNKSFAEIAAQLQTTEAAAQRRIARAVEKLRGILAREGVAVSPAALPAALAAQALHPAPPSLAAQVMSLAGGSKAASTSLIAKGALHAMAAAKVKAAAAIAAAVLLVGVAGPTAYRYATARPGPLIAGPPPQLRPTSPPVTPLPPLPAGTDLSRPVTGSLPPGMTAEPLAIMNKIDKRWIRPTGEELINPPVNAQRLLSSMSNSSTPNATHALLFRVTDGNLSPVTWSCYIADCFLYGSTGTFDSNTRSNYMLIVFAPTRGTSTAVLGVNAADGPWTNNVIVPASATAPTRGSINGAPVSFDPPTEKDNEVKIKRPSARVTGGLCTDFYGVDAAGKRKYGTSMTADSQGNYIYTFPGPLSSYKEFRLDTRPYNYHATYAPVPLSFSK